MKLSLIASPAETDTKARWMKRQESTASSEEAREATKDSGNRRKTDGKVQKQKRG